MNVAMAWLFGKSVIETCGFTVNFVVHIAADAIIFAFFVMAAAKAKLFFISWIWVEVLAVKLFSIESHPN